MAPALPFQGRVHTVRSSSGGTETTSGRFGARNLLQRGLEPQRLSPRRGIWLLLVTFLVKEAPPSPAPQDRALLAWGELPQVALGREQLPNCRPGAASERGSCSICGR